MEIVDAYEKWEECGRRTPTFLQGQVEIHSRVCFGVVFVCLFVFLFLDCLIMLLCGVRLRGENVLFLFGGCFFFVGGGAIGRRI